MRYQRILLAYDGPQEGKHALLECDELANFLRAETHLLAVASVLPSLFLTEGFVTDDLIEEEKARTRAVLDEGIARLRERGFSATGCFALGEPAEEICRTAKELRAELIVVGHGQRRLFAARWWNGSLGAATLLDSAPYRILFALSGR